MLVGPWRKEEVCSVVWSGPSSWIKLVLMVDEVMMGLGACLLARTEEGRQHTEIRQEQEKTISDDHATTATPQLAPRCLRHTYKGCKNLFSHRSRKPPNSYPTHTQRHHNTYKIKLTLNLCFGVGQAREFFQNSRQLRGPRQPLNHHTWLRECVRWKITLLWSTQVDPRDQTCAKLTNRAGLSPHTKFYYLSHQIFDTNQRVLNIN
jgi:hypothetical protein